MCLSLMLYLLLLLEMDLLFKLMMISIVYIKFLAMGQYRSSNIMFIILKIVYMELTKIWFTLEVFQTQLDF